MGQKNSQEYDHQKMTKEVITKVMQDIFGGDPQKLTLQTATTSGYILFKYLSTEGAFKNKQNMFYVNPILLKCVFNINFDLAINRLMQLMASQIKFILQSKMMAVVPRQRFKKLLTLMGLVVYFIDQQLLKTLNFLNIRSDLHPESKDIINSLDVKETIEEIIEDIETEDRIQLCRILRLFMMQMIDLHTKLITRSETTFAIIDNIINIGLILYGKVFFSQKNEISTRQKGQNSKALAKISAFAIGLGIQTKSSAIFQTGVILLSSVMESKVTTPFKNIKAFPSHLFKSLPIMNSNNLIHWVICNILNVLIYKRESPETNSSISLNRIFSFKLIQLIFKNNPVESKQITYFLQKICIQTRPEMIQRVYVSNIAEIYCINNLDLNSQILKITAKTKEISFNVKTLNKNIRIRPEDIMTQLQNDENSFQKEMMIISSKFILETVFEKVDIKYEYSDKSLWNEILYKFEKEENEESEPQSTSQLENHMEAQ